MATLAKAQQDRTVESGHITRLERRITDHVTTPMTRQAVHVQIEKARQSRHRLLEINQRVMHSCPADQVDGNWNEFWSLEDRLDAVTAELSTILQQLTPATTTTSTPGSSRQQVKLPELHLPTFSGQYEDWPSFEDLFTTSIGSNSNLSGAQKLQYLKSCTAGDAHNLIKSFTITHQNYTEAWNLLEGRYKNTREIVSSLVRKIHTQPKCTTASPVQLQALLNTTMESIRSLNVLGRPTDTWDDLIVFYIVDKLDPESRSEWAKSLKGTAPPTYKELLDFLEDYIRALLAKGDTTSGSKPQNNNNNGKPRNFRAHHAAADAPSTWSCSLCKGNHPPYRCDVLLGTPTADRFKLVQGKQACVNCLSGKHWVSQCTSKHTCKKCHKKHHTLLHHDGNAKAVVHHTSESSSNHPSDGNGSSSAVTFHSSSATQTTQVLLKTAVVLIEDRDGKKHPCRALLDDGSETSFITEELMLTLGLNREKTNVRICGVSATEAAYAKWKVYVRLHSLVHSAHVDIDALALTVVTGKLPTLAVKSSWKHLEGLQLADPSFNKPGKIDLLLGADVVASVLRPGIRRDVKNSPVATNTLFGWVLSGRVATTQQQIIRSYHSSITLEQIAQALWTPYRLFGGPQLTQEEQECEQHFLLNFSRDATGRYQVRLPFHKRTHSNYIMNIGDTRRQAELRLLSLERRFVKYPLHHEAYKTFMQEYVDLGHMELVSTPVDPPTHPTTYIPHHFVLKEDSTTTKLRVVFDASMKSSNGISLNSTLMVGPTVQDDLFSLLLRFRMFPIALKGDIAKMYRQFRVHPADSDAQRILWRFSPSQPIQEYRLQTVTYGTASAPYLATRCLQQLATDEADKYPAAANVLRKDMYVDDMLSGAATEAEARLLVAQLNSITAAGGMEMRKYCSNSKAVMESIAPELREDTSTHSFDKDDYVKTLGIVWQPTSDCFTFQTKCKPTAGTKRELLSEIAKVFDPLGWLAPFTITAKLLFQSSWREQQGWDDPLTPQQQQQWSSYQEQISSLAKLSIPRYTPRHNPSKTALVGFSDSSEKAYAACVYICELENDGSFHSPYLLASKSRIAPLKQITLPRLELCGAVLLCELVETITKALNFSCTVRAFTDSMIVLQWISNTTRRWKTFVANRITAIHEVIPPEHWQHVRSEDNPSDLPSRGISAEQLLSSNLWWNGPTWLNGGTHPVTTDSFNENDVHMEERPVITVHTTTTMTPFITSYYERFSSFNRLVTHVAILQKFIQYLKNKQVSPGVSPEERKRAIQALTRADQRLWFAEEIKHLSKHGEVHVNSKLASLNPFISNDGLLRVGGRIPKSDAPEDTIYPMILSKSSHLSEIYVRHIHLTHLHSSLQLTLAAVQRTFWIVGARGYVRNLIRRCIPCRRGNAKLMQQQMGNLPASRVNATRAFMHSGVDFSGHLDISVVKGRGRTTCKYYFAIFICMATKAIHLETVSSLSTDAFIAAFRRFVSRRGICSHLYCDQGTNFIGGERELAKLLSLCELQVKEGLSKIGTTFHFNPPAAPNQGGLWESGVKNVKRHLRRVIGDRILSLEQLQTLLCQVEACLNSRPICALSSDPADFEPLTPGHFLIGTPLTAAPDPSLNHLHINRLDQWQLVQQLGQHFWDRWRNEYLVSLQQRAKWRRKHRNVQVGDMVLISADNIPSTQWKIGRVIETYPGADGLVRSVLIKVVQNAHNKTISFAEFVRPINKLAIILKHDE